jgi:hypothetical protein
LHETNNTLALSRRIGINLAAYFQPDVLEIDIIHDVIEMPNKLDSSNPIILAGDLIAG